MATVKLYFGTLYDIKPYLTGFWAAFVLSSLPLQADELAWSKPVNGLKMAVQAQAKDHQTVIHFHNVSEVPLTLLHPDTQEALSANLADETGAVLMVESLAKSKPPSPLQVPFAAFRSERTGLRQAFILQPGEERQFVRPAPRHQVPLVAKWPGEVELLEQEIAPGSTFAYRYANHRAEFLGDALWHGEVVSPPLKWGSSRGGTEGSPLRVRLEPVTEPGQWQQPLRVKLTLSNDGPLTVYARLAPNPNAGLWSLLGIDGQEELVAMSQAKLPTFPQPEHHVVLEPGQSRAWVFQPEDWLQLERPGQYRLRLNAQLHWHAARDWGVANTLSLLRLEQLESLPIDEVAEVYLPPLTADVR